MSAAQDDKYAQGFVFSSQQELDQLQDPANYMDEVEDAKKAQAKSIEYHQKEAERPLEAHSRAAYQRRIRAKKAVREAKAATKNIKKMEAEIKEQVVGRRTYLEAQKVEEKKVYVEAAKKKEQEMKFLVEKEKWVSSHKIADIPEGIEKGYLSEGSMSWYNRLKALEAPYANRRTDLPARERNKLEFLYKGGTEKAWGDIIERERVNRQLSQRQSASIKGAAAIVESGGTLGGKYTAKSADGSLMGSDLRATSTDPKIAAANQAQSAYVAQLRAGGIGLAQALLKPQTDQSYIVKGEQATKSQTSINLETFLTERGYDISKPETIPDSIFKAPEKYVRARAQTKEPVMGDLRTLIPEAPQITQAEIAQRKAIQQKFAIPESPVYSQGSRTILTQEDGKGKISVMPIGEPKLISGDESKQAPHLTITKTETITKPDKYEQVLDPIQTPLTVTTGSGQTLTGRGRFGKNQEVLPIDYEKGFTGGFLGYPKEIEVMIKNFGKPEDQQEYATPSLETAFFTDLERDVRDIAGGKLPPLINPGMTYDLLREKDPGWLLGSGLMTGLFTVGTLGAQRLVPAGKMISNLLFGKKNLQAVETFARQTFPTTEKYSIEKLPSGKFLLTVGTEGSPATSPAIVIQPGRGGTSKIFSDYLPSQTAPSEIIISGGTKGLGSTGLDYPYLATGLGIKELEKIAPYLYKAPGSKDNIWAISDPKVQQKLKPTGQITEVPTKELLAKGEKVLEIAEKSDVYAFSRGLIVESQALKTTGSQTAKQFTTKTGKIVDTTSRKNNPITGEAPPGAKPNTQTLAPSGSTTSIKETAKEMGSQTTTPTFKIETGTASAVLGTKVTSTDAKIQDAPRGTTDATLSSIPQTTTFTGTQTTTTTTSTPLPLSRNLIMDTTPSKEKASIPLKDIARDIASVREKQNIKSATIPLSKTAIRQQPGLETPQAIKTNLRLTRGFRLTFKTTTKLALVPALKMTTTPPIRTPPRRPPGAPLPFIPTEIKTKKKEKKTKRRKKRDFLGNVSESSVLGLYGKRSDIIYGKKRVQKLSTKDRRLQKSAKSRLEFLSSSSLKRKAKRKPKTETILGKKWPKNVNLTKGRRAKRSPTRI